MKLSGAKATSKPCRIQMSPTMMRTIPEASRSIRRVYLDIWGDPGEHSVHMQTNCLTVHSGDRLGCLLRFVYFGA